MIMVMVSIVTSTLSEMVNLTRTSETYVGHCQAFMKKLFGENS